MAAISEQRRLGHEIRNGMNALQLNAACLKICEPHEALECVEAIISASAALVDCVDRLAELPEAPPAAIPSTDTPAPA